MTVIRPTYMVGGVRTSLLINSEAAGIPILGASSLGLICKDAVWVARANTATATTNRTHPTSMTSPSSG